MSKCQNIYRANHISALEKSDFKVSLQNSFIQLSKYKTIFFNKSKNIYLPNEVFMLYFRTCVALFILSTLQIVVDFCMELLSLL